MYSSQLKNALLSLGHETRCHRLIGSCFLNADLGIDGCRAWLQNQMLNGEKHALKVKHKQKLINTLVQSVEQNWDQQAQSVAMFWDVHKASLINAFPLPIRLRNRISINRKPDIRPFVPLLNPDQNLLILLQFRDGLQVIDVDMAKITPMSFSHSPYPIKRRHSNHLQGFFGSMKGDSELQTECLSLMDAKQKPLLIAARGEELLHLRALFPDAKTWNLDTDAAIREFAQWSDFLQQIALCYKQRCRQSIETLTRCLITSAQMRGPAVVGSHATLRAIKRRQAHQLVITEKTLFSSVSQVTHSNIIAIADRYTDNKRDKHQLASRKFSVGNRHVIELCWMALRQNLPVYLANSDELQMLGGIGCTINPGKQPDQIFQPFYTGNLNQQLAA